MIGRASLLMVFLSCSRPAWAQSDDAVVVDEGVPAAMRDGVVLRADILRPDAPGTFPAIVIRTPYGKRDEWREDTFAIRAARSGYVVVSQDVRGRYASDGAFDPYRQEGKDGYDTVEWVASLPYVNGRVGMTGLSYPGAVQWLAAVEAPPHLVTIAPAMCFSTGRRFFYFGGAFDLSWLGWFYRNIAPDVRRRQGIPGPKTYEQARALWRRNGDAWLRFLPLRELPALEGAAPAYYEWLEHPDDGPYWSFADIASQYDQIDIPALNLSGWHDEGYGPGGAAENFNGTREHGSRLVIGPWTHGTPTLLRTTAGELDFGVNAGLDYETLLMRWFDHWLKGIDNGVDGEPPVQIFVMGANVWRDENEWPLDRAEPTPFYLRSGGSLSRQPPEIDEEADVYYYDPRNPVVDPHGGLQGPYDQSPHEARDDVLVYTSPVLAADVEVTGPIEVELWASSSARDTDFVVRLLDVHPDGKAYNVMSPTLEVVRARYRVSESEPRLLVSDRVERFRLRNGITSNVFKAGHRLRVHVTSSFFPHVDRNLNTGEPFGTSARTEIARQRIYHDAEHRSHLVLPVIPESR